MSMHDPRDYSWNEERQQLIVDFSRIINSSSIFAVNSWQHGLTARLSVYGEEAGGDLCDQGLPKEFISESPAFTKWYETFPKDIREALVLIPRYYWDIAVAAKKHKRFYQLLVSHPQLAYFWFLRVFNGRLTSMEIHDLLSVRQPELLRQIGLPATKSMVKVLRCFSLGGIAKNTLSSALQYLNLTAEYKALRHLTSTDLDTLKFMATRAELCVLPQLALFMSLSKNDRNTYIDDTLSMTGHRGFRLLLNCHDRQDMVRLHDELVQQRAARRNGAQIQYDMYGRIMQYPTPPLREEIGVIEAITTPEALTEEGQEMNHCVSIYSERIYWGEYAVYKCLFPERATIGLVLRNGIWRVDQIQGVKNQAVSEAVKGEVSRWFLKGIHK